MSVACSGQIPPDFQQEVRRDLCFPAERRTILHLWKTDMHRWMRDREWIFSQGYGTMMLEAFASFALFACPHALWNDPQWSHGPAQCIWGMNGGSCSTDVLQRGVENFGAISLPDAVKPLIYKALRAFDRRKTITSPLWKTLWIMWITCAMHSLFT